jgi:integrase
MAISTNIAKRPGSTVFYARLGIPPDLQPIMQKRELWKSLRTRDPREARERVLPVLMQWRAGFAELRRRRAPAIGDLQKAVWSHYEGELERDLASRLQLPTASHITQAQRQLAADIQAGLVPWSDEPMVQLEAALDLIGMKGRADYERERRSIYLKALRQQSATGETVLISWAADETIRRDGLLIERGSPEYRDLCQRLLRTQIEVLERAAERDQGNWTGAPRDPIVAPPDLTLGNKFALRGESIMELYERFKAENPGSVSVATWERNRRIVKRFAEFVGETSHVIAMTRTAVRDWKQQLQFWPLKAGHDKIFEGMSFRKIIDANASAKKGTISKKTINKYLFALGTFANWLLSNDYLESDVMRGMYLTLDKQAKTRFPYSADQLSDIFTSPLFDHCGGDGKEHAPGNVAIRDWRYWIPWIGLYSGARLGEIAQLLTADIRQEHGIWIFHITREGSVLKSTKTAGSQRVVPVHSKLIGLRLIDHHHEMIRRGERQLFPQIKADKAGLFSCEPSKFFNRYFRRIGVKTDETVNFHSFRHGIADAFRRAGYLDEQFNMLLGHTKATTTGTYGIVPQGILSERVKMIEAVSFFG